MDFIFFFKIDRAVRQLLVELFFIINIIRQIANQISILPMYQFAYKCNAFLKYAFFYI